MVMPGPGEAQLIGYDPSLPPSYEPETPVVNYAQDPNSNGSPEMLNSDVTPPPPSYPYIVTFQVKVMATNAIHAQLICDHEGGELINSSAERLDE